MLKYDFSVLVIVMDIVAVFQVCLECAKQENRLCPKLLTVIHDRKQMKGMGKNRIQTK